MKTMDKTGIMQTSGQRLADTLERCCAHWRKGEDQEGLEMFLYGMEDLEALLAAVASEGEPFADAPELKDTLRALDAAAKNRDITGMTDVLQYRLCPLCRRFKG